MPVYLRHPLHGEKIAYNEIEASDDRAHGWVEFDPPAPPAPVVEEVVEEAPEVIDHSSLPSFLAPPKPAKSPPKPKG